MCLRDLSIFLLWYSKRGQGTIGCVVPPGRQLSFANYILINMILVEKDICDLI